jgi:hypothetical protein
MVHSDVVDDENRRRFKTLKIAIMDKDLRELLQVTNILCGKVFDLCRKDETKVNKSLAVVTTGFIRDIIRLFEHSQ